MSEERDALIEEYHVLDKSIEARGSNALLLDSIMIPSSLLLLWYAVANRVNLGLSNFCDLPLEGFMPLLTLSLIIVPWFFHFTSKKLDDVCFDRIEEIESALKIKGHTDVYEKIKDTCWYGLRRNMWNILFSFLGVAYIYISIWLFTRPM